MRQISIFARFYGEILIDWIPKCGFSGSYFDLRKWYRFYQTITKKWNAL